ncbi:YbaB/EbfC family nucleoid-associated protein [Amycolatopsis rhizosphaerae]|uniref:YbaB/EbfC family nucleoid-associated protein n=1 Tax=Amycolatopsis rhizosphaerae TaxID=2053003 RepID=A0A558ALQ4_9PSEU|nr:YbaB/EbfC family nucleoid-associated protein [Amycolatopsis rhizosphaerae]TVT25202.1 YbaB/EbfC family nucleoid-associated protein [Amycolatopsis rhizosphaerae]
MNTPVHVSMYDEYRQLAEDVRSAQGRMAEIRAEASSEDGLITAIVGSAGELVELRLDARIYRAPDSAQLAADITAVVHQAAELARRETFDILASYLPPGAQLENTDLRADPLLHQLDRQVLRRER